MLELDQVSIWDVIEPTQILKKQQPQIENLKFVWYRGGFFEIGATNINMLTIEYDKGIRKVTYVVDRKGYMDQIVTETEIIKENIFWKNINRIVFSDIKLSMSRNTFTEDRFCIKVNNDKILAGPYISKKTDKQFSKFLKLINVEDVFENLDNLLSKYIDE